MSLLTLAGPNFRNQSRRRFKADFKQQVVEYLLRSGATVAEVARKYEVHPNQLCRWRTEYRKQMGPSDPAAPERARPPSGFATRPIARGGKRLRVKIVVYEQSPDHS